MDCFIEYMITQKKTPAVMLKKILLYTAAILVSMLVSLLLVLFGGSMLVSFIPIVCAGIIYIAYRLSCASDIEFEYILTNGELDIDKITHKKSRRRLMTIHCKAFTCFSAVGDKENIHEENGEFARVIDASAKSSSYEDYYAIFFKNGQKIKLIFNPTKKMIEAMKLYAPRVIK